MSMATAAAAVDFTGKLTDTCTIRRYAEGAVDPMTGQTAKTWSDLDTLVECRVDDVLPGRNLGDYETKIGKQVVGVDYICYFEAEQDITEKDRVTTIVRGGVTLVSEEIGVLLVQGPGGFAHHKEVYLGETRT